jgi:membrane-bound ClpP family serine protease
MWQNWIIGLLGIWLIIASFTVNGNVINELIVGISVAILGFWTAIQS